MSVSQSDPKSRRRPVAKSTKKSGDKPVKVGLYLSLDAARRLGVTATMEGGSGQAIRAHLVKQSGPTWVSSE